MHLLSPLSFNCKVKNIQIGHGDSLDMAFDGAILCLGKLPDVSIWLQDISAGKIAQL